MKIKTENNLIEINNRKFEKSQKILWKSDQIDKIWSTTLFNKV